MFALWDLSVLRAQMFLQPAQSALTPIRLVSFQKISALSVIQNLHALTEV